MTPRRIRPSIAAQPGARTCRCIIAYRCTIPRMRGGRNEVRLMVATQPEKSAADEGRVGRKRTRKIRDILMATAEVLNRDGYHAMSLEDVAEKVDLTKATLYHYFNGKDELVSACLALVGAEVNERLRQLAEQNEELSATDSLRALLADQLTIMLIDYPEAARLFAQPLDWLPEHMKLIRSLREEHDAVFRAVINKGSKSGEFSAEDPNLSLHCIYGAMNYAPVWVRTNSRAAARRVIDSMCDALMKLVV
jgi:AcrR family transcriptional regulator